MNLIQKMIFNNDCFKQGRTIAVKGLMLHSVGCNQPSAMVFINLWNKPRVTKAVHAFIEPNGNIYQILPFSMRGWHGGGSSNNTHLGFEMTEPASIKYVGGASWTDLNPANTRAHVLGTYKTAVELFAFLCKELNLNPLADGVIISHLEGSGRGIASRHFDPEHIWNKFGLTMNQFRLDVKSAMNPVPVVPSAPVNSGGGSMPNPQPNTTQYPTLRLGSNGAFVVQLQNKLNALGFNVKSNGDFGDKTRLAVIAFQKVNKLVSDGIVGINSWKILDYVKPALIPQPSTQKPTLRPNSRGEYVVELQNKLNALGFNCGVDGIFGSGTQKVVIAFQKARGLVSDSVVGAKTWFALDQSMGKKAIVVATSLNIRKSANILSGRVGSYRKGEQILVIEEKTGWYRTNKGWISAKYVKLV